MLAGNRAKSIFIPQVIARCFQNLKDIYLAVYVLTGFRPSKFASKVHYGDRASDVHSPLSSKSFEKKYIFLRSESENSGTCVSLDSVDHERRNPPMEARTNE